MKIYINQAVEKNLKDELVDIKIEIRFADGTGKGFWVYDVTKNLLRCCLGEEDMNYLLDTQRDAEMRSVFPVNERAFGCTKSELSDFIKDGDLSYVYHEQRAGEEYWRRYDRPHLERGQ